MNPLSRRLREVLRREAHDILQGGPPTVELMRPIGPDVPGDDLVYRVLDLCLHIGDVLLASGETAAETADTIERVAADLGLRTVETDVTFTSITVCCRRGKMVAPVTLMRVVRHATTDLSRLAAVGRVVDQVTRGELGLRAADAAVEAASRASHPYPRWVVTVGWGGVAAAVALLFGGGPLIWLTAFVVTAVIDRIGRVLARWGMLPFFLQLVGGFVATMATVALMAVGALPATVEPSLVISVSITVLLSGLSVVNAVQDAISGHPVTAAGRTVEVGLLSAGLLAGVIIGLEAASAFHLSLDPAGAVGADVGRFGVSTLSAAAAAAMFAVTGYAPLRSLATAGLAGGAGWAAFGGLSLGVHLGPVVSTGLAAVVIGVASELFGRLGSTDRHVVALAGIVPLLPGLTAYRGFYQLASAQQAEQGLVTVTLALAIGLALAAGVTFGQLLARRRPRPALVP